MPVRAAQVATFEGATLTLHPATSDDKVAGVRHPTRMLVVNDSTSAVTLTIPVPGRTNYGEDNPDKDSTIPAGVHFILTLLPEYRDPADGDLITLTWSDTTDVSWAVIG